MKSSYDLALKKVLEYEGGYVNHPSDPGGPTNKGITQRVYDGYRKRRGLLPQSVKLISPQEVAAIYRNEYWDKIRGDELPSGVDLVVFDYAVNSGPLRSIKLLQNLVGTTPDGVMGPKTLEAAFKAPNLIDRFCDSRLQFLRSLKTFSTFGKGWTRRVQSVREVAKTLMRETSRA